MQNEDQLSKSSSSSATGAAAPQVDATMAFNPSSSAPDLLKAIATLGSMSMLSQDIEKYVTSLKELFGKNPALNKAEFRRLVQPESAHAIINGGVGVVLTFTETMPVPYDAGQNYTPIANPNVLGLACNSLKADLKDIHILGVVAVKPQDYSLVHVMYSELAAAFVLATNRQLMEQTTFSAFEKFEFVPDINPINIRNHLHVAFPHADKPRVDVGVLVSMRPKRNYTPGAVNEETGQSYILGVGGYVELVEVRDPNQNIKFQPILHLTQFRPSVPNPGTILLALHFAVTYLVKQAQWKLQYSDFSKGAPNLGNLLVDKEGKVLQLQNADERNGFINQFCLPPAITLDVVNGHWCTPFLNYFTNPASAPYVWEALEKFFENKFTINDKSRPVIAGAPITGLYGVIEANGQIKDSRSIDYLTLAAKEGILDANSRQVLLHWHQNYKARAAVVDQKAGLRPISYMTTSILGFEFLQSLAQMASALKVAGPDYSDSFYQMDPALNQSMAISQGTLPGFTSASPMGNVGAPLQFF